MIRPRVEDDDHALSEMLAEEGIEPHRMQYQTFPTFVMDEEGEITGFYTMREEHGFPSLQHFCVKRGKRDSKRARQLARHICELTKGAPILMHAHRDKERVQRLIERYWKATLYGETEDKYWYFVEGVR